MSNSLLVACVSNTPFYKGVTRDSWFVKEYTPARPLAGCPNPLELLCFVHYNQN